MKLAISKFEQFFPAIALMLYVPQGMQMSSLILSRHRTAMLKKADRAFLWANIAILAVYIEAVIFAWVLKTDLSPGIWHVPVYMLVGAALWVVAEMFYTSHMCDVEKLLIKRP